MDLILVVHRLKGGWSGRGHWLKSLEQGADAESRFQHVSALPNVYPKIMSELRNEVYLSFILLS